MITKECKNCHKPFQVYPSEVNKKIYCNKRCRRIKRNCLKCWTEFEINPARTKTAKFCSYKCSTGYYAKLRMRDQNFKNRLIEAGHTKQANKNRAKARTGITTKIDKICLNCSTKYKIYPSKKDTNKFCSITCGRAWWFKHGDKRKRTWIERKMAEFLTSQNIQFEEQKAIPSCKCIPDFYIPSKNVCLFTDGTFWHSSARRQFCDRRINNRLEKKGYHVIRVWEHDMLKQFDKVAQDLLVNLNDSVRDMARVDQGS